MTDVTEPSRAADLRQEPIDHIVGDDVTIYGAADPDDPTLDFTGASGEFRLYDSAGALLHTKAVAFTGTRSYTVDLTDGTSYGLAEGNYRYRIVITAPVGRRHTGVRGPYSVTAP